MYGILVYAPDFSPCACALFNNEYKLSLIISVYSLAESTYMYTYMCMCICQLLPVGIVGSSILGKMISIAHISCYALFINICSMTCEYIISTARSIKCKQQL